LIGSLTRVDIPGAAAVLPRVLPPVLPLGVAGLDPGGLITALMFASRWH